MVSAQESLRGKIATTPFRDSNIQIVMNVPGDFVNSLPQMRQALIDQVASPVRWEKGIRKMMEQKIEAYVEIGPGKTLSRNE